MLPRSGEEVQVQTLDRGAQVRSEQAAIVGSPVRQLEPLFVEKGLVLDSFGIREIGFSPDYIDAIEQKQIEKERVITEQYRAEQAEKRKDAVITEAEGEAEAIRIKGEALRNNPDMVQLEFVRSLRDPDSKVKVMVIPSEGVLPLLDLGAIDVGE